MRSQLGFSARLPLLVIGLSAVAFGGCSKDLGIPVSPTGFKPRASENIAAVVAANARARSLEEWQESGQTPEAYFDQLEKDTQGSFMAEAKLGEVCDALARLDDENLALFERAIQSDGVQKLLPCTSSLSDRIDAYWKAQQSEAASEKALQEEALALTETAEPKSAALTKKNLRSEVVIDASNGPVLRDGELAQGEIALTFDDGPHPTRTEKILKILNEFNVRATFFQVGEMVHRWPGMARAVYENGHTVGTHSWSHAELRKLPLENAIREIASARDLVGKFFGIPAPFFRFPYGAWRGDIQSYVKKEGMATFFWNMDSSDWQIRNKDLLYRNVVKEIDREKRGIILFHDIQEQTVLALPNVLKYLKTKNYQTLVFLPRSKEAPLP